MLFGNLALLYETGHSSLEEDMVLSYQPEERNIQRMGKLIFLRA
jgi:hypothetical protein